MLLAVSWVECDIEHKQSSWLVIKPGETVSITCTVTGASITDSSSYLGTGWIRQPAGKALEWINHIYYDGSTNHKDSLKNKFSVSRDTSSNTVTLTGNRLQTEDAAVYYCARLRPTVVKTSSSLNKKLSMLHMKTFKKKRNKYCTNNYTADTFSLYFSGVNNTRSENR
uniref:Ig-like domain-containing protein n=1 Tax=Denticeps clupeoides TaxID=299321 RepID=A0AAY4BRJ8_9TELE